MLLKSVIFHYHGLDEEESKILKETAEKLDAQEELTWANAFIAQDYITSFERARQYLNDIVGDMPKAKRLDYVNMVWEANHLKGYATEMEAQAIVRLARDWKIDEEFYKSLNFN
ncbi:MAG: hypothetical protein AAFX87_30540 [Bacteroidota bacterium]